MGHCSSTIKRELDRGLTINGTYFTESTERQIRQRKLNDKRKRKMDNPIIYDYVACRLKNKLSPAMEKGMVENINGLIRRFFPKGTNFATITD